MTQTRKVEEGVDFRKCMSLRSFLRSTQVGGTVRYVFLSTLAKQKGKKEGTRKRTEE